MNRLHGELYFLFNRSRLKEETIRALDQAVRKYRDSPDTAKGQLVWKISIALLHAVGFRIVSMNQYARAVLLQADAHARRCVIYFVVRIILTMLTACLLAQGKPPVWSAMISIAVSWSLLFYLIDRRFQEMQGAKMVQRKSPAHFKLQKLSEYLKWHSLPPKIEERVSEIMKISDIDFVIEAITLNPHHPTLYVLSGGVILKDARFYPAVAMWVGEVEGTKRRQEQQKFAQGGIG